MHTFKKEERLCNKKLIDRLFHNGSSFLYYPFRVMWLPVILPDIQIPVQILIAVSKKRFRRAVDRNLIKRYIREAYRSNKQECLFINLADKDRQLIFSVSYIGKEIARFDFIEKKMQKMLVKLSNEIKA